MHIARSFFGTVPSEILERTKNLGGVINDFKKDHAKALKHHQKSNTLEDVKAYIEKEEINFSTQIVALVEGAKQEILNKHPRIAPKQLRTKLLDYIENGPFEPLIAIAIIYVVSATLQLQLPQSESLKRVFSLNL